MSRGWGAAGMPFTMYYLNHYAKAQNYLQQQRKQEEKQRQNLINHNNNYRKQLQGSNINRGSYQDIQMNSNRNYNDGDMISTKQQNVVPQLFVSHGWGPMG